jgi:ribonuclease-3
MNALQVKLGHHFSDLNLLNLALTHRSCGARNNERMEFLGDSILNFVAADYIYERFPRLEEGSMSRVRAALICEKTLVKVAKRLELGLHIKRNSPVHGSGLDTMLADAVEALFAAGYKDAGYAAAKKMIVAHLDEILLLREADLQKDPKTTLQELLQGKGHPLPIYSVVRVFENEQDRYEVTCSVPAHNLLMSGRGPTRKLAERAAAEKVVKTISR